MIALVSRWKLRDGCPPELAAGLDALVAAVRKDEPGTLFYSVSLPAPHPPIGPPPEYEVDDDPSLIKPVDPMEIVFMETYRDAHAFSEHLRGAVVQFMTKYRDFFATPWQGHPRPEVTYLTPREIFARAELT
jgi:quinol monooxygenase YgiN